MKPNARQRLLGGALLLAGAIWGMDALTGKSGPAPAVAQAAKAPATPPAGPAWAEVDEVLTRLTRRADDPLSAEPAPPVRDLFWPTPTLEAAFPAQPEALAEPIAEPSPAEDDFAERHRLVAVMLGPTPLAVVDEKLIPLHAELDGFRLVSVSRDHVVFRDKSSGRSVELVLAERPQKGAGAGKDPAAGP
jgi:hypothetical protein